MRHSKNWSLALAIVWTVCLIVDAISAFVGDAPSWTMVFCPLIILVIDRWGHYADEVEREWLAKNGN